ncbi:fused MFS/spermidine synthase [Candidatus Woesearchaeota archaeon]|nr:fused MFS/spermidine synthase [Candidatus Woesearchaeota archaeon]
MIFLIMFLTGFSSLLYEVVLLLVFSTIIGATETSIAIILSTFLLGLALGGLFGGILSKRKVNHVLILVFIEIVIALFAFTSMPMIKEIALLSSRSFGQFFLILLLVLIPTFLMGVEIPLAVRILTYGSKPAHPTGFVYFSDTFGGVLGSFLSGIIIIPILGFYGAMIFGGVLNIFAAILGIMLFIKSRDLRSYLPLIIILMIFIGAAVMLNKENFYKQDLNFFNSIYDKKDFYYAETIYSTISPFQSIIIANSPYFGNQLYINGDLQVSDYDSLIYHEFLVLPAFAVHPNPKKILVIGGGDGGALYQILKFNATKIDHVELDKKVIDVSQNYLKNVHKGTLDNQRVNTFIEDGRYFLANNKDKYDIIIIDLPDPKKIELAALYSKEFYQLVHNSLEDDGVMVTQTNSPYHYLFAYASTYNAIRSIFPNAEAYTVQIPSMGNTGYIIASKTTNLKIVKNKIYSKWYNSDKHEEIFYMPEYLTSFLENNTVPISTDTNPVIHLYSQPVYYAKGILDTEVESK